MVRRLAWKLAVAMILLAAPAFGEVHHVDCSGGGDYLTI